MSSPPPSIRFFVQWKYCFSFARPPIGDLRWEAPQKAPPFNATYNATDFIGRCPQIESGALVPGSTDEDCLYVPAFFFGCKAFGSF